jgi:hypothetical protein
MITRWFNCLATRYYLRMQGFPDKLRAMADERLVVPPHTGNLLPLRGRDADDALCLRRHSFLDVKAFSVLC